MTNKELLPDQRKFIWITMPVFAFIAIFGTVMAAQNPLLNGDIVAFCGGIIVGVTGLTAIIISMYMLIINILKDNGVTPLD